MYTSLNLTFLVNSDWDIVRETISDYLAKNNISFTTFVTAKFFEITSIPTERTLKFDILIDEEYIEDKRICKIKFNKDLYNEVMIKIYSDLKLLLNGYILKEKYIGQQFCYV